MTPSANRSPEALYSQRSILLLLLLVLPFALFGVLLVVQSNPMGILSITEWFDPLFFQYNVFLWLLFVLLIPCITYFYVHSMREEREGRLRAELDEATWKRQEDYLRSVIQRQFGMANYIGSTLTLMIVVAMGLVVLLLLKPLPGSGPGLDYGKGGNLFLMGAYIGLTPGGSPDLHFERIVSSLTAFQFGFLGAYVYFVLHLVRSYFTLDLTPNTFVAMSIRMVTAGLIALVLSFVIREFPRIFLGLDEPLDEQKFRALLPVVSFGIGCFPEWGLVAIQKLTQRVLLLGREKGGLSTSLSDLSGVSYEHEVRLRRQGYDSIENLAEANLVELAVRTGFSYAQLRTWAGEAWLRVQFGPEDYSRFVKLTGVRTADQFRLIFGGAGDGEAAKLAVANAKDDMPVKIACIARLARDWEPIGQRVVQSGGQA